MPHLWFQDPARSDRQCLTFNERSSTSDSERICRLITSKLPQFTERCSFAIFFQNVDESDEHVAVPYDGRLDCDSMIVDHPASPICWKDALARRE